MKHRQITILKLGMQAIHVDPMYTSRIVTHVLCDKRHASCRPGEERGRGWNESVVLPLFIVAHCLSLNLVIIVT